MIPNDKDNNVRSRREELLKSRLVTTKCPNCGSTDNSMDARFCSNCGARLTGESMNSDDKAPVGVTAVDLGLPSGTRWASCNVGAARPEEFGGYYSWGETEEKSYYDWETYIHCDGDKDSCHDIGENICGTKYDVAHVKWGGRWQMPSREQVEELCSESDVESVTLNGVQGARFTGPNGNSIFLPATGHQLFSYKNEIDFDESGGYGSFWSGSLYKKRSARELYFEIEIGDEYEDIHSSCGAAFFEYGLSVRPVLKE